MSIVGETMTETGKEKTASAGTDTAQGKVNQLQLHCSRKRRITQ